MSIWSDENKKFVEFKEGMKIPNEKLEDVSYIDLKTSSDFGKISNKGGVYWIVTNEKVNHSLNTSNPPKNIYSGTQTLFIIYNGVADKLRSRISGHLLSEEKEKSPTNAGGHSAISIDVFGPESKSHRKILFSKSSNRKTPYMNGKKITKESLDLSSFTQSEIDIINNNDTVFFSNGIDIFDNKHKNNLFRIYFISDIDMTYASVIETSWRDLYGVPLFVVIRKDAKILGLTIAHHWL